MGNFILFLNRGLKSHLEIVACCCGHHGKHPMTIVVYNKSKSFYFDMVSGKKIPRKKKFYKKDKQGYYYIPEVVNES